MFRKVNVRVCFEKSILFQKVNFCHFLNTVKKFVEDTHFGLDEGLGLRAWCQKMSIFDIK